MSKYTRAWAGVFASVFLSCTPALGDVPVQAPCDPTGKGLSGLRTCQGYFGGNDPDITAPGLANTPNLPDLGISAILKTRFARQINALYGIYADPPPTDPAPGGWSPAWIWHSLPGTAPLSPIPQSILFSPDALPGTVPGGAFGPFSTYPCNIVGSKNGPTPDYAAEITAPDGMYHHPQTYGCGQPVQFKVTAGIHISVHQPPGTTPYTGPLQKCVDPGTKTTSFKTCPAGVYDGNQNWDPVTSTSCNQSTNTCSCLDSSGAVISTGVCPPGDQEVAISAATTEGSMFYTCIDGAQPNVQVNAGTPNASQENSYLQGTYAAALSCFYNKYATQIASPPYTLNVADIPYGGGPLKPSECQAQANALKYLHDTTTSDFGAIRTSLSTAGIQGAQFTDILNCKNTWDTDIPGLNTPRISSLRQQAQHLCAMRADIEEAFYRLAECQILAETNAAWLNVIVDHLDTYWGDQLQQKVVAPCGRYCKTFMTNTVFHAGNIQSNASMSTSLGQKFDAIECGICNMLHNTWLGDFCDPGNDGSKCDQSANCPVQSPYTSGIRAFETDAERNSPGGSTSPGVATGTLTQNGADDDLNFCVNECYQYGVTGGTIASSPPATTRKLPTQLVFNVPIGTVDGADNTPIYNNTDYPNQIPKFTTVIQDYLKKQWPATYDPAKGCALGAPNP